jgi:molybdate transport system substrate-binding protein
MSRLRPFAALALAATVALGLAACTAPDVGSGATASAGFDTEEPTGSITVFAAASLQQTFTTLGKQFETANPGASIRFSFAGSSDLVTQIQNGAPADVFASADEANMAKLSSSDLASGSSRSPSHRATRRASPTSTT